MQAERPLAAAAGTSARGREWWQRGIVYQVYPRSFQDSDGDGVGDLAGIRQRIDYLHWLGVDAVWLSPVFPSPMADFGYDVADYTGVDPLFGSLGDLDGLISDLHRRGMRLLLDFVPNHTSDQHPWFLDARSSRTARHRDWYIWRDPAPGGGPPNDWRAAFGGSAWQWDEATGQYYFHAFLPEQPDLDWSNAEVREAMHSVLRFWLDRGVDGFRVDVIWLLAKGPELEPAVDAPREDRPAGTAPADGGLGGDRPDIHNLIAEMRRVVDEYDDRLLIGEIYLPFERLVLYYGESGTGLHLPFNFALVLLPWRAAEVHAAIESYEGLLPAEGWPNWVLGNHDQPRVATRVGPAQARVAQLLLLTLRGTPTIYYGDELGLTDLDLPPGGLHDPQGLRGGRSRDPQRAPMPWDDGPAAGFTKGRPWLPVPPDARLVNVSTQRIDERSMLNLTQRLIAVRRSEPALNGGAWHDLGVAGDVLAYIRSDGAQRFLVALNLGPSAGSLPPAATDLRGTIVIDTALGRGGKTFLGSQALAPAEGVVVLLDG